MTNTIAAPALVSILFTPSTTGYSADLQVCAQNVPEVTLTVIHESITSLHSFDLVGQSSSQSLHVQDSECLVLLARQQGVIIASGAFEISVSLAESIGLVLIPHASHNLVVDQCEGVLLDRAFSRAIASIPAAPVTGGLRR